MSMILIKTDLIIIITLCIVIAFSKGKSSIEFILTSAYL